MKIEFEITNKPTLVQLNTFGEEAYIFYLEGILKIFIQNYLFFNQPGILLIEYAISINNWLNKIKTGNLLDFTYETMDHPKPIFSFIHIENGYYKIKSIWEENEITKLLNKEDIINGFEKYLNNLDRILKMNFNINLEKCLNYKIF